MIDFSDAAALAELGNPWLRSDVPAMTEATYSHAYANEEPEHAAVVRQTLQAIIHEGVAAMYYQTKKLPLTHIQTGIITVLHHEGAPMKLDSLGRKFADEDVAHANGVAVGNVVLRSLGIINRQFKHYGLDPLMTFSDEKGVRRVALRQDVEIFDDTDLVPKKTERVISTDAELNMRLSRSYLNMLSELRVRDVSGDADLGDDWRASAGCKGEDTELFYPEHNRTTREAKRICLTRCPAVVRDACLADAITRNESFGVWGGLTEPQRRQISRKRLT